MPSGKLLAGGLDLIDRHQLVEVGLDHLAAQLQPDRQVRGQLDARPRLDRMGVREGQVRLGEGTLKLADEVGLPHSECRIAAAEQDLPPLAWRGVG